MRIVDAERIGADAYERLARDDPDRDWELYDGVPREKPSMSFDHNDVMFLVGVHLYAQLDPARYRVRVNAGRVRHPGPSSYIPDVMVIPTELARGAGWGRPGTLEFYDAPLPLVVEVWPPSTGAYNVGRKLPLYKARGDRELWFLHPYERTVTASRRQPAGTDEESFYRGGVVPVASLPGVAIDLDALFAESAPGDPPAADPGSGAG